MTSPRWARDIKGTRWYAHPTKLAGQPVWLSVTHTISALPKEAIPRWAAKMVAEYAYDHQDEWMSLRRDDWEERVYNEKTTRMDTVKHKGAVSFLKAKPWEERDRAAERGTTVHSVIEKMINGEPYAVERKVYPWVESARRFVDEVKPEPRFTEVSIYNDTHWYAGSADFVGALRGYPELGDTVLVDWKTGKGIYPDMAIQMVAYAKGDYYLDDADREQEWPRPTAAAIVHLGPNGYQVYRAPLKKLLWDTFLAARQIRLWQQQGPGLVKLPKVSDLPVPSPDEADWNQVWRDERIALLRSRVASLELERRLELSLEFARNGWPTVPTALTDPQLDAAVSLANLYLMAVDVEPADQPGPARRPMP